MPELTLEDLARRAEALEKELAEREPQKRGCRKVVGVSEENNFTRRRPNLTG